MVQNTQIYLSAPDVGVAEEEAALRAIRSGWVAPLGPEVVAFEAEVAARVSRSHGVALSSGPAALHLGLLVLGVKPGDVVITSTMTFVATANAITYVGAQPFFVDSVANTGNMNPDLLRRAIEQLRSEGRHVGAIVPVDLLGKAADYSALSAIAEEFQIPILCDAAESLGAFSAGMPAGSWGDLAVVSFNGNKIMTTSGGGMLLTNDAATAERVRFLATQAREPEAHYQHATVGYNYRLSNVLAAIGRAQLAKLDEMIVRRRAIRDSYRSVFAAIDGVTIFGGDDDRDDNCWLTAVLVDSQKTGWSVTELTSALALQNIESRPLWKPMHLQPLFASAPGEIDGTSEMLFNRGLTLPSGSGMSAADLDRVIETIERFLANHA
jgi:dTDP-4-amino-4,6-dideoxygalactose transaminase